MAQDYKPIPVNKLDIAFGGKAMEILPPWSELPKEFTDYFNRSNKWTAIITQWFFKGLPEDTKFIPKDGIDETLALANIAAVIGSFEPKHEHKTAGAGYLLSLWFDDIVIPQEATA